MEGLSFSLALKNKEVRMKIKNTVKNSLSKIHQIFLTKSRDRFYKLLYVSLFGG